jgi:hypothetical protein
VNWVVGITTVPKRLDNGTFQRTLASLRRAGFESPRIFVDGLEHPDTYRQFGLPITTRWPAIRTYGNWILGLGELYLRSPSATRYAMFQDDLITYTNLREYLEKSQYPEKGYCNLYTFPQNQEIAPACRGWFLSNQLGRGAVALVFNREAVIDLLTNQHTVVRAQDPKRGWQSIDGGIVTSLKNAGWKEYCHNPSLVQHVCGMSTMDHGPFPEAPAWRGEHFDALELL